MNNAAALGPLRSAARKTLNLISTAVLALACAPQPCTPPECDIRLASCQRRIMNATACDRGVAPRDVPTRVVALDEYVSQQLTELDDRARFNQEAAAFALLGLQEPGNAEKILGAFYANAGAFYDRQADEITVLERGEPLDGPGYSVLMVHEFAHALQPDPSPAAEAVYYTLDRVLARSAIAEGDATLTMDRAAVRLFDAEPNEVNWKRVYREWAESQRKRLAEEPYRVTLANWYFPYAFGSVFLEPVRRERGQTSINRWLAEPPDSTRAILAGAPGVRQAEAFEANAFDPDALLPPRLATDARADASDAAATHPLLALGDAAQDAGVGDAAVVGDATGAPSTAVADAAADAGSPLADAGDAGAAAPADPLLLVPELDGHRLLGADALGQFVFEAFAESVARRLPRQSALAKALRRSSAELRSDHLSLWVNEATEAPAAVYRLRFADPAVRDAWLEVSERLQLGTHATVAAVHAGDLVLVASAEPDRLAQLDPARLRWRTLGSPELDEQFAAFREHFSGVHVCPMQGAPLGLGAPLLHR